jgi:hypothetical protein
MVPWICFSGEFLGPGGCSWNRLWPCQRYDIYMTIWYIYMYNSNNTYIYMLYISVFCLFIVFVDLLIYIIYRDSFWLKQYLRYIYIYSRCMTLRLCILIISPCFQVELWELWCHPEAS